MHSGSAVRECVRITAANGAILECSDGTPFTLQDGSARMAGDMMGLEVLTDSVGFNSTNLNDEGAAHLGTEPVYTVTQ
jgi:hypothetical protein